MLDVYLLYFPVISSHSVTSFPTTHPPTLAEVLEPMSPIQLEFFNKFNAELSKVESFFIEREAEARERTVQLRGQLEELKDHRRLFHVSSSFISSFARYWLEKNFNKGCSPRLSSCSSFSSIFRVNDLDPDELRASPLAPVPSYGQ
jgi:SPX domain